MRENRVFSFLLRTRRELLSLLLAGGEVFLGFRWAKHRPTTPFGRFLLLSALGVAGILLFYEVRRLWREKWRRRAAVVLQKAFGKVARLLTDLMEKWNIGKGKSTMLSGKRTVVTFERADFVRPERKKKPPKWKNLDNARDKLRYLYRGMITARIRDGEAVYSSETPAELREKRENPPIEETVFAYYINCRYDETAQVPDEDEVSRLRTDLGITK